MPHIWAMVHLENQVRHHPNSYGGMSCKIEEDERFEDGPDDTTDPQLFHSFQVHVEISAYAGASFDRSIKAD